MKEDSGYFMNINGKLAMGALVLSMLFSTSAFAASTTFSGTLPAKQGDTEVSTVGRANAQDTVQYFSIKVTKLSNGYSSVRAWTEEAGWQGENYSNPYTEVSANSNWHTPAYTTTPAKGDNVTLNRDNPVYTTSTVSVEGEWSPN
ncbi:hypothetical protein [Paenibacillus sp. YYML68]|uniref:hypothetical protein n=1 Tax=Paenibacillus sp. YYML68 TaxID=2909250 RepID=UPI002492B9B6|nr:hypothetical protein [Paenibacillus sp. YYML68]